MAFDATVQSGADGATQTANAFTIGDITFELRCFKSGATQFLEGRAVFGSTGNVSSTTLYSTETGGGGSTGAIQADMPVSASTIFFVGNGTGVTQSANGTALLRTATQVLTVTYHGNSTFDTANCSMWGSVFAAPRT